MATTRRVYHEKQVMALCGVHALNALLQAPIFNEVDLSDIARSLDKRERDLMAQGGLTTPEFLNFVAEDSQNVSNDGNFSVSVLCEALQVYNLQAVRWSSGQGEPNTLNAFICNRQQHWFTVRRLFSGPAASEPGGRWYDLNSLRARPERISDFYLSAFLHQMVAEGYTIFAVEGALPQADPSAGAAESGRWWSEEEIEADKQSEAAEGGDGFSDALAKTLATMQGVLAGAGSRVQSALGMGAGDAGGEEEDDPELRAALQASLEEFKAAKGERREGGG